MIPIYAKWVPWLSPSFKAYQAIMVSQLEGVQARPEIRGPPAAPCDPPTDSGRRRACGPFPSTRAKCQRAFHVPPRARAALLQPDGHVPAALLGRSVPRQDAAEHAEVTRAPQSSGAPRRDALNHVAPQCAML